MNFYKLFGGLLAIIAILAVSSIAVAQDDLSNDDLSVSEVLGLMAQAHTQYNQIHVRYIVDSGGQQTQHEVWLDNGREQFRHEITSAGNRVQLTVSDGLYAYLNPGPTGVPITLKMLSNNQDQPLANRMLGGMGTLISPVSVVENRLSRSEIVIQTIEVFDAGQLEQPMTVAKLQVQTSGFLSELWVDLETGVIVKELIYGNDGSILSTTTLEMIEFDSNISSDLFVVDESQYNIDQLREIFPPAPTGE